MNYPKKFKRSSKELKSLQV